MQSRTYDGDLVVEVEKVELAVAQPKPHVLIHIKPIAFEVVLKNNNLPPVNTRVVDMAKVDFTVPLPIKTFTGHDLLRAQAIERANEGKRLAAIEEQRRQRQATERERRKKEMEEQEKKYALEAQRKRDAVQLAQERRVAEAEKLSAQRRANRTGIDRRRADGMLLQQQQMDQATESRRVAKQEAARRSNDLLKQGYKREEIDWEAGALRSETQEPVAPRSFWPMWMAMLTATILGAGVAAWRWWTGLIWQDLSTLSAAIARTGEELHTKSADQRLVKIDIPDAKTTLGRAMHRNQVGQSEYSDIYRELHDIAFKHSQISDRRGDEKQSESDSNDETTLTTISQTSHAMKLELQNQLALVKLRSRKRAALIALADGLLQHPELDPQGVVEGELAEVHRLQAQLSYN